METIKIDGEFKALIPPLTPEEKGQLEANIAAEGCRDALVVWEGIILDGHNRFEICQRLDIPYQTVKIELPDREAAADWIDRNQLGRRNLTADQMSLLRGRLYNRAKKSLGDRGPQKMDQNEPSSTAAILAKEHGVSPATIKRDGQLADAVEKVKPYVPDIVSRVMSGDIPSKQAVISAAREPELASEKLKPHVAHNSGEQEWYTPTEYIEAARKVMGCIDLDPASSKIANRAVQAATFYCKESNGLDQHWTGNVFLNPPYSSEFIKLFISKFASHVRDGDIHSGIVLVNNATDTVWFRELIDCASAVVFTAGRVKFLDPQGKAGAPLQGQAFIYCGDNPELFTEEFERFGWSADLPASRKRSRTVRQGKNKSRRTRTVSAKKRSHAVVYGATDESSLPLFRFANGTVKEAGSSILA